MGTVTIVIVSLNRQCTMQSADVNWLAGVAQLVEHNVANVVVAGSSPVARSSTHFVRSEPTRASLCRYPEPVEWPPAPQFASRSLQSTIRVIATTDIVEMYAVALTIIGATHTLLATNGGHSPSTEPASLSQSQFTLSQYCPPTVITAQCDILN